MVGAGLGTTATVVCGHLAIQGGPADQVDWQAAIFFVICATLAVALSQYVTTLSGALGQRMAGQARRWIATLMGNARLDQLDRVGLAAIHDMTISETTIISNSGMVISGLPQIIVLGLTTCALASLSMTAFVVVGALMAIWVWWLRDNITQTHWRDRPLAGMILWDSQLVNASNVVGYHNLFSAVFANFHLFDRPYGLTPEPVERLTVLLVRLGLAPKNCLVDGQLDTRRLSTGQRKRLALAVALAEDRPIHLRDEFASDQEPAFREQFYAEILPELKARGKSVIVITHDDRHFTRATSCC